MSHRYEVTVSDFGTVYSGQWEHEAKRRFRDYVVKNEKKFCDDLLFHKTITMTRDGETRDGRRWDLRVALTPQRIADATAVGIARQAVHDEVGRVDPKTIEVTGAEAHIQGAIGESVISEGLGIEWDGKFFDNDHWLMWRKNGRDVGPLGVRATLHATGGLPLHPSDPDDAPFLLVLLHANPMFNVPGWIRVKDGKRDAWWQPNLRRPCFLVPQNALRPISELMNTLQANQK